MRVEVVSKNGKEFSFKFTKGGSLIGKRAYKEINADNFNEIKENVFDLGGEIVIKYAPKWLTDGRVSRQFISTSEF
jgi:hypothetical protein